MRTITLPDTTEILVPESSDALYRNPGAFGVLAPGGGFTPFPHDYFFAGVSAESDLRAGEKWEGAGERLYYGLEIEATLHGDKTVIHPKLREAGFGQDAVTQALVDFFSAPENHARYPTFREVRDQQAGGKGLYLLSAGGLIFTDAPQQGMCAILSRRQGEGNIGRLQMPGGLAASRRCAASEIFEEITLHVAPHNGAPPYYAALSLDGFSQPFGAQDHANLQKECARYGLSVPAAEATPRMIALNSMDAGELGLPVTRLRLYGADETGKSILLHQHEGFTGYEDVDPVSGLTQTHTLIAPHVARFDWPTDADVTLLDREFGRKVAPYSGQDIARLLAENPRAALSGTSAIIAGILAARRWPEPVLRGQDLGRDHPGPEYTP